MGSTESFVMTGKWSEGVHRVEERDGAIFPMWSCSQQYTLIAMPFAISTELKWQFPFYM